MAIRSLLDAAFTITGTMAMVGFVVACTLAPAPSTGQSPMGVWIFLFPQDQFQVLLQLIIPSGVVHTDPRVNETMSSSIVIHFAVA